MYPPDQNQQHQNKHPRRRPKTTGTNPEIANHTGLPVNAITSSNIVMTLIGADDDDDDDVADAGNDDADDAADDGGGGGGGGGGDGSDGDVVDDDAADDDGHDDDDDDDDGDADRGADWWLRSQCSAVRLWQGWCLGQSLRLGLFAEARGGSTVEKPRELG